MTMRGAFEFENPCQGPPNMMTSTSSPQTQVDSGVQISRQGIVNTDELWPLAC
jgi:hypothetical protein